MKLKKKIVDTDEKYINKLLKPQTELVLIEKTF